MLAMILAAVMGEFAAWGLSNHYGFRLNPVTVAFLSVGIVAVVTSVIYDDVDIG